MEKSLPPPDAEGNIFDHFDVPGELLSGAAETSTELLNREVNPTPSNVGNKVGNEDLHKLLSPEGRSSHRGGKSLARLGKLRPSTTPDEIPRELRRRGLRPRNADAAGFSAATEPAHHQKKKRHSIHSTNRSHSSDSSDSDSSDLVVLRVVAPGEDPSGDLWKQFMEKTRRDVTPPSNDGTEDVNDLSVDRTLEDPNHYHNSADMEEFGEEPLEDSAWIEDALPSLPELHDSGAAEMGEVEEEELEDFVAPENAFTAFTYSQPKSVWEHSSVKPQDFQGDVLETLPNPTAEMDKVEEEAPEVSVAVENVLSSLSGLQPEFGVTGLVEHDNVLPQEFPGETHGLLPNTHAEMAEVGEEALEGFVAPGNFVPRIQLMQSEGTKVPSLKSPIDFQAAPVRESVSRVHMDPAFINGASAAGMSEVGEEALEELAAPRNWTPLLPSNAPQETGEQSYVSSLNTNASSQDFRNIQNSRENQFDPFQVLTTFKVDWPELDFECEPDVPLMDDPDIEDPEEFFQRQAMALTPQPMQQSFSSGSSEASNYFPADPDIGMDAGLEYELPMRLQGTVTRDTSVVDRTTIFL